MSRRRRERAILRIVEETPIRTQQELADALAEEGMEVTQSTVSRDVRRLGLVRTPLPDGSLRYARPPGSAGAGEALSRLRRLARRDVTEVAEGEALLAVRTPPGAAGGVAAALDDARLEGVVGTVAGDDTIFVLVEDGRARRRVRDVLQREVSGEA